MDLNAPSTVHEERRFSIGWFSVAWCCGPAAYGASYLACLQWPGFCDDPPNVLLLLVLFATHVVAIAANLVLLILRGVHWRWPEFWLMLLYWAGLAGWLVPEVRPLMAFVSARIAAVVAGVISVLYLGRGLLRLLRA